MIGENVEENVDTIEEVKNGKLGRDTAPQEEQYDGRKARETSVSVEPIDSRTRSAEEVVSGRKGQEQTGNRNIDRKCFCFGPLFAFSNLPGFFAFPALSAWLLRNRINSAAFIALSNCLRGKYCEYRHTHKEEERE